MPSLNFYDTLTQATKALRERGFTEHFVPATGGLRAVNRGRNYTPKDLFIVEYHRFEGMSSSGDMSVMFALKTTDGVKGTLSMNYGAKADMRLIELIDKIPVDRSISSGNGRASSKGVQ